MKANPKQKKHEGNSTKKKTENFPSKIGNKERMFSFTTFISQCTGSISNVIGQEKEMKGIPIKKEE